MTIDHKDPKLAQPDSASQGVTIDPKGTTPGLTQANPAPQVVNLKCKMCPSMTATIVAAGDAASSLSHNRWYKCTDCGYSWALNVGGFFSL